MTFLPDTNVCVTFLRDRNPQLIAKWQAVQPQEIALCSIVVYELRHGAECSVAPVKQHQKLDAFLKPYTSLPFDDDCAVTCSIVRRNLERGGVRIGPHDLQIAAIALQHDLILVTHNTAEFSRVENLRIVDWEKADR